MDFSISQRLASEGRIAEATDFSLAGIRHNGRKGDAVFFWNVHPDGRLDRQTLHAGLPPTRGEKWLLSQWLRNKPA